MRPIKWCLGVGSDGKVKPYLSSLGDGKFAALKNCQLAPSTATCEEVRVRNSKK